MNTFETVDKLVSENMGLVYFHTNNNKDLDRDEVFSAAMKGLLNAANLYNDKKEIPFGKFASLHIKWEISHLRSRIFSEKRGFQFTKISLDSRFLDPDSEATIGETIRDESAVSGYEELEKKNKAEIVRLYLDKLSNRQRDILSCLFGLNGDKMDIKPIARKYNISPTRISQIRDRSIKILKEKLFNI